MGFDELQERVAKYFESVRAFDNEHGFNRYDATTITKKRSDTALIFENVSTSSIVYKKPQEILRRCFFIDLDKPERPDQLNPLSFLNNAELILIICQIPENIESKNRSLFQIDPIPEAWIYSLNIISLQEVLNSFSYFRDRKVSKKVKELLFGIVLSIDRNLVKNNKPGLTSYFQDDIEFINKISSRKSSRRNISAGKSEFKSKQLNQPPELMFEEIFTPKYKPKFEQFIAILTNVKPPLIDDEGRFIKTKPNSSAFRIFFDKLREKGIIKMNTARDPYGKTISKYFPGLKDSFIDTRISSDAFKLYDVQFDDGIKKIIA